MVLVLCEMQSVTSRIWTRVAVSISYDDNHCTTGKWLNSYIWSKDGALTGSTAPSLGEPESNGNEGVFYTLKSSRTGASPSDSFVSYTGHSLEWGFYPSIEVQSVYSTAPGDWVRKICSLKFCSYSHILLTTICVFILMKKIDELQSTS